MRFLDKDKKDIVFVHECDELLKGQEMSTEEAIRFLISKIVEDYTASGADVRWPDPDLPFADFSISRPGRKKVAMKIFLLKGNAIWPDPFPSKELFDYIKSCQEKDVVVAGGLGSVHCLQTNSTEKHLMGGEFTLRCAEYNFVEDEAWKTLPDEYEIIKDIIHSETFHGLFGFETMAELLDKCLNPAFLSAKQSEEGRLTARKIQSVQYDDSEELALKFLSDPVLPNLIYISSYPIRKTGTPIELQVQKIYEMDTRCEAIVKARNTERSFRFFATDWYYNRNRYYTGAKLKIRLMGLAYFAEIVPDKDMYFVFRDQKEIEHLAKSKGNPKYFDVDGIQIAKVIFFQGKKKEFPNNAEFLSPIFGFKTVKFLGEDICRFEIKLNSEMENIVPVFVKKIDGLNPADAIGKPCRGILRLFGCIVDD